MKKIITICLLIISFLAGSIVIDAKTTNKKRSTSTTLNYRKFVVDPPERGPYITLNTEVLKANGYIFIGRETRTMTDSDGDAYETICEIYRSPNGSEVIDINSQEGWRIAIKFAFATEKEKEKFIRGWQKFFHEELFGGYMSYGAHDQVLLTIEGNTVRMDNY